MSLQPMKTGGLLLLAAAGLATLLGLFATPGGSPQEAQAPGSQPRAYRPKAAAAPVVDPFQSEEDFPKGLLREGEELRYQLYWNEIPAGQALLQIRDKVPLDSTVPNSPLVWRVRLDTRSNRLFTNFGIYPVEDKVKSVIDVRYGCTRRYSLHLQEGGYTFMERFHCEYKIGNWVAEYSRRRLDRKLRTYPPVPLEQRVLDPLAALYYIRARTDLVLENRKGITLPIFTEGRVWETRIVPNALERLPVSGFKERQWCLMVTPECGFNGLFQRRSKISLWLHNDTRIPVKMVVETPIGHCVAKLAEHKDSPLDLLSNR